MRGLVFCVCCMYAFVMVTVRLTVAVIDLLSLIRETENDDLTSVLQKFVCEYSEDIVPLAVEITTHLVLRLNLGISSYPFGTASVCDSNESRDF